MVEAIPASKAMAALNLDDEEEKVFEEAKTTKKNTKKGVAKG